MGKSSRLGKLSSASSKFSYDPVVIDLLSAPVQRVIQQAQEIKRGKVQTLDLMKSFLHIYLKSVLDNLYTSVVRDHIITDLD